MMVPVIDLHGHIGAWPQYGWDDDLPGLVASMDRAGVDAVCLFYMTQSDAPRGNDVTAEACRRSPGRFIGFAFVTPHYPEEMVPELERCFDRLDMRGIKLYPRYTKLPLTAPEWQPIFAFANERGVPLIIHAPPDPFLGLAQQYPRASWIIAHAGGGPEGRAKSVQVARQVPNIFLEICSSSRNLGSIEQLVRGAGADRVLYGSDVALFSPALQLGRIMTADLTPEEKRLVVGGNALRLLGEDVLQAR
ncbi:MAG: amidohydrolase family protein [Armatimonadetes bacterium]|nr:amidohydrolase family protein [Armatimonadota bacterium]